MAKLTAKQRDKIPAKDFGLPGGRYPMENKKHEGGCEGEQGAGEEEVIAKVAINSDR
ncbi:hypothetical protein [Cupriavidus metallidurans]|jgi:hypothetical protein|uniref:hypothetical protein n=1 Tax=Cupriavidus metallidurans TaxID=119219 RepID=UPI001679A3CB|nr:hypothetical protein [Cupriavidus metallidurans]QWC87517.1 hypothetical protein KB891_10655 [Cupriavidus metallidurans]